MSGATTSAGASRRGYFKLTLVLLGVYLAVGALLSVVYADRKALSEEFRFAGARVLVEDAASGGGGPVVVDAARQDEIDRYQAWSKPPTGSTRLDPPISPPGFAPRFRLGRQQRIYAILNPLTLQPLQAGKTDWEWAVSMARRGRLDLLDTQSGVRSTLTGQGLEQSMDTDLGVQRQSTSVVMLQLGDYRPPPGPSAGAGSGTGSPPDRHRVEDADFVSRTFELTTERPVAVTLEADLSNAWMSIQGQLHNDTTRQQQTFSLMLREVHGVGSTGSGDGVLGVRRVGYLEAVPRGNYTLHLHAERSATSPGRLLMEVHEGGSHNWSTLLGLMVVVGGVGLGLGVASPVEQPLLEK